MLEVFDLSRNKTAILQNAFDIIETEELNAVGSLRFSMPDSDPKISFCQAFHYVRYDGGQLYRILAPKRTQGDVGVLTYECEHVIATLIDDIMFGAFTYGNLGIYTTDTISYILGKQTAHNWDLHECDFVRQFEYGWENENLLAALFSVPNRFADPYMWVYDTSVYPWRLSLKRINEEMPPEYYIRANKNFLTSEEADSSSDICTRLYCLGYGEGVNQLRISSVNDGVPYIQSPAKYIDRYGIISRIWTDRRFEDANSLLARGRALLAEYQEPRLSRTVSVADLYELTNDPLDAAAVGKIAMLTDDNVKTYLTKVTRHLDTDGVIELTIANKPADIATSVSNLADRQRIEQVYAQGATNLYGQSVQANASPTKGAVIKFFVPEEMRIVNAIKAKIALNAFRSYSRATRGGGATSQTSSDGGGSQSTSSSGGGSQSTSSSGGGGTTTSGSSSSNTTSSYTVTKSGETLTQTWESGAGASGQVTGQTGQTGTTTSLPAHTHTIPKHYHSFSYDMEHYHGMAHTHTVTIYSHSHTFSVPSHTHTVNIPSHAHQFTLPDHTHEIEQGIFELGSPTGASIYVNGTFKGSMNTETELDLTAMLLDGNGNLPRGSWLDVEIRPNDLAYVTIDLFIQGFVQSRGGSTY